MTQEENALVNALGFSLLAAARYRRDVAAGRISAADVQADLADALVQLERVAPVAGTTLGADALPNRVRRMLRGVIAGLPPAPG